MINAQTIYKPRRVFSPSQFKAARDCIRKWVLGYIYGLKDDDPQRGRLLGTICHARLRAYGEGRNIYQVHWEAKEIRELERAQQAGIDVEELIRASIPIVLAAQCFLPPPGSALYPEHKCSEINKHLAAIGVSWKISTWSSKDLIASLDGYTLTLTDYKTTSGKYVAGAPRDPWGYVPTIEELLIDDQVLTYALDTMLITGQHLLPCRWLYLATKGPAQAKPVDFEISREYAEHMFLTRVVPLGDDMAAAIDSVLAFGHPESINDWPKPANALEPEAPCHSYGGCGGHISKGRKCNPGGSLGTIHNYYHQKEITA